MDESVGHLPSYGQEWDRAIEEGIDVGLIDRASYLSPVERIQELVGANLFSEGVRSRTMSCAEIRKLEEAQTMEKLALYGPLLDC